MVRWDRNNKRNAGKEFLVRNFVTQETLSISLLRNTSNMKGVIREFLCNELRNAIESFKVQ